MKLTYLEVIEINKDYRPLFEAIVRKYLAIYAAQGEQMTVTVSGEAGSE